MSGNLLESGWHGFQKQPDWAKALISLGALVAVAAGGYYAAPALGAAAAGGAGAGAAAGAGAGAGLGAEAAGLGLEGAAAGAGTGAGLGAAEAGAGAVAADATAAGGTLPATTSADILSGAYGSGGAGTSFSGLTVDPTTSIPQAAWYDQLLNQVNPSVKTSGQPAQPRKAGSNAPPVYTPPPGGSAGWSRAFGQAGFNPGAIGGVAKAGGPTYRLMGRSANDPRMALLQLLQGGGGG